MTNHITPRKAHELLDRMLKGRGITDSNVEALRELLPPRPKQKTAETLASEVYAAWMPVDGNNWPEDDPETMESFLYELFHQLKGLIHQPALPAGMRLAEHEEYGRVVVSPKSLNDGRRMVFVLDGRATTGACAEFVPLDSLTIIDAEPAHPVFLETVEDYDQAPQRTIVAKGDAAPWVKLGEVWESAISQGRSSYSMGDASRRVLRWGDK